MSRVCEISGKRPMVVNSVIRRGKAKADGGVGKKTTGISKRWQAPNLRKVTVQVGEHSITFKVATSHVDKVYELVERSKGMNLKGLDAKQVKNKLLSLL